MAQKADKEHVLTNPPQDGISSVKFSRTSDLLLAASWDETVRLYDARRNATQGVFQSKGAVLDASFLDDTKGFMGGLDKAVKMFDFGGAAGAVALGVHSAPVRCVEYLSGTHHDQLVTGSWDKTVKLWDHRASTFLRSTLQMPGKVYSMDVNGSKLVVGCSNRFVVVYDLRKLDRPEQMRESSLKFQTRCIKLMPDNSGYVLSSVEGRVAVEYLDPSPEVQSKKYAFKCHRQGDTIFPVNAMAFHPVFGTFATGGCDGTVNVWDGTNKKRLINYTGYPTSISSVAFNRDGMLLAIASSYTFEQGEKDHPTDAIYVREVNPHDVKPKPRKSA